MAELQIITESLCKKCKYSTRIDYFNRQKADIACDYIGAGKGSRCFEFGEYRLPHKMCDKYEPQVGRRKNGHEKKRDTELKRNKHLKEARNAKA